MLLAGLLVVDDRGGKVRRGEQLLCAESRGLLKNMLRSDFITTSGVWKKVTPGWKCLLGIALFGICKKGGI